MSTLAVARHNLILSSRLKTETFLADKKTVEFVPGELERGEKNNAFAKDWDRLNKELVYKGESIYNKFKKEFDSIEELDNKGMDPELQSQARQNLEEKVKRDFDIHLANRLGLKRSHIIEEINWRFSQKALTQICALADVHCAEQHKGFFRNGNPIERITLEIPLGKKKPVQVTAFREVIHTEFLPLGKGEKRALPTPVRMTAKATYTIGLKGPTTCKAEFCFDQVRTKSPLFSKFFNYIRSGFLYFVRLFLKQPAL